MGLTSLKQKILNKLTQESYSEEDVVYLLMEIGKYLERSEKGLSDSDDMKLNRSDYKVIMFFRNWVAHTEKDRGKIPENLLRSFKKVLDGHSGGVEEEIFKFLKNEIEKFQSKIDGGKINWEDFCASLKLVLAEQPVRILCEGKYIGYDGDPLKLKEVMADKSD